MINRFASVGCSHTHWPGRAGGDNGVGWPSALCKVLGAETVKATSSGAGVSLCADKLSYVLQHYDVDYVVFQAPSDLRQCIGTNRRVDTPSKYAGELDTLMANNQFYTWIQTIVFNKFGAGHNKEVLEHNLGSWLPAWEDKPRRKADWDAFCDVWDEYFFDNYYETKINFVKQLWNVENICKYHNKPYKIFTWHQFNWEDDNPLFRAWADRLDYNHIVKESIIEFFIRNNMCGEDERIYTEYSDDRFHLNAHGADILAKEFMYQHISGS